MIGRTLNLGFKRNYQGLIISLKLQNLNRNKNENSYYTYR